MTIKRTIALVVVAAAALAVVLLPRGHAAQSQDLSQFDNVQFVVVCSFSHMNFDDPIVYPDKPGRSHEHTFFGNVSTDAESTPQNLPGHATSCSRSEDTAAYWAPTLYIDGKPVAADDAKVYYRRRTIARVTAFPPGLEMIAGNSAATAPQNLQVVSWDCGENEHGRTPPTATIPDCTNLRGLELHVRFPDCWNGQDLDSPDHKAHMAYSVDGRCPGDHPVAVPSIEILVRYSIIQPPPSTQLSSSGQYSGHADFINTWNEDGLKRLVNDCLNALRLCGPAP